MGKSPKDCPTCLGTTMERPYARFEFCEEHDVCISCGVHRKDLDHTPWGTRYGSFQCKPCEERERKARVAERQSRDIDHEYTSEVVCPYCGYEMSDSWEYGDDGDCDCPECENTFSFTRSISVSYTSYKNGEDDGC